MVDIMVVGGVEQENHKDLKMILFAFQGGWQVWTYSLGQPLAHGRYMT
jgi:hypothetical protein